MIALFVPGDRPERFARAAQASDVAILDLEDAVAPERKSVARAAVAAALAAGIIAWVRVNPIGSDEAQLDLRALGAAPPAAVMLAKTRAAGDVESVRAWLPNTPVYALIETIAGIVELDAIAAAAGVAGLAFGAYDLCAELGARATPDVLAPWRARLVLAARRFDLASLDTPFVALSDSEGLAADARRGADFGFTGKLAIHPAQVPVIRAAFAPTEAEIARARAIVDRFGSGVGVIDGSMIDAPLLALARQTLARATSAAR
jgi:citrate lyase beta subunit